MSANASSLQKVGGEFQQRSGDEQSRDDALYAHAGAILPQLGSQWNVHSLVLMKRHALSRVLYCNELYKLIVDVPGVICEFGVQWGATLATLMNLRGMYEPYNHSRKIIGFDTFEGFASVDAKDGGFSNVGDYATTRSYETVLEEILSLHESFSPLGHIKKFELVKGDACVTAPRWFEQNPHAIVSMALFDMDVYKPTRDALEAVIPRLTRGSVLVFDELNCQHFPGETVAMQEMLNSRNIRLRRFPHQPYCAWAVWGE